MEKKEPSYIASGSENWYGHYGKQYGGSSKIKNDLPYDPAIPQLGIYPQRLENPYPKIYLHTDVHSSIIHSGQDMEATKVSYDR